jgi:hypothetical protein
MHESVRTGERGVLMGNMLRRGGSSWLCMKFEIAFFAGHGILMRVLQPSCLTLPVKEIFLHFWPNPCVTLCCVLHAFVVVDSGIAMLFWGLFECTRWFIGRLSVHDGLLDFFWFCVRM